jgi:DNA-binding NarL/FixJ family response regulator
MVARFLLVEDHALLARAITTAARGLGIVHVAKTVEGGMASLAERRDWSCFVIDVRMPDGNGLDVLAQARALGCEAPALVHTALHDPATINRAFELRARYLVKPVGSSTILSFLSEATRPFSASETARVWMWRYELTETEIGILTAAAEGSPRDQLAFERGIATTTLKRHVHNLLCKTGDESLLAAVARLLRDREAERRGL